MLSAVLGHDFFTEDTEKTNVSNFTEGLNETLLGFKISQIKRIFQNKFIDLDAPSYPRMLSRKWIPKPNMWWNQKRALGVHNQTNTNIGKICQNSIPSFEQNGSLLRICSHSNSSVNLVVLNIVSSDPMKTSGSPMQSSLILHSSHTFHLQQPWIDRDILHTPSSKSTKITDDRAVYYSWFWSFSHFWHPKNANTSTTRVSTDSRVKAHKSISQSHMTLRLCRSTGWSLSGTISTCSWCSRGKKT